MPVYIYLSTDIYIIYIFFILFFFFLQYLKAVITPECLLILDYRNLNLEQWLFRELPSQLAGKGQLVTYLLPFEFRAIEALLQYRVSLCLSSCLSVFWFYSAIEEEDTLVFSFFGCAGSSCCVGFSLVVASGAFSLVAVHSLLLPWLLLLLRASLVAQMVKNLPAMQETGVQYLDWEDPLEKEMALHSSILA